MLKLPELCRFAKLVGLLVILVLFQISSYTLAADPFARPFDPFKKSSDYLNDDKEDDPSTLSPFEGNSSDLSSPSSSQTAQSVPVPAPSPRRVGK